MVSMQTGTRNWWQRFTSSIRRSGRGEDGYPLPPVGSDGLLVGPAEGDGESVTERAPGTLTRWTKRDHVINQLQEGYEQVTRLINDIQRHLATQAERTDRICSALEQMARNSSDLPDVCRQQVRTLESIAGQLEVTSGRTQRLAEAVEEVPRLARTQADALGGINRQLSMVSEQGVFTTQAVDKLGNVVRGFSESNSAQVEVLRQMYAKSEEHNTALRKLVEGHNKRFVMLFAVTLVLAVAGVASVIIAALLRP